MKAYIVANWKMNFNLEEAEAYFASLLGRIPEGLGDLEVIVAAPFIALSLLGRDNNEARGKVRLAAQNCYWQESGAYTGEIAARQLVGLAEYVILGHSERRRLFAETDELIKEKVAAVIRHGMGPILCVGETEEERSNGLTKAVLRHQLEVGLELVNETDLNRVLIAYEPVWAISSGASAKVATPDQVRETVGIVREIVDRIGEKMPILFGGSVNENNIEEYLAISGVDGVLVGNASLNLEQFIAMINLAKRK